MNDPTAALPEPAGQPVSEAVFTAPTTECPSPWWWTATDAEATEDQVMVLVAALVTALQPELVVETGTYLGIMSRMIGQALQANGHGQLHTVECDPGRAAAAVQATAGLPVTVHVGSSLEFTPPGLVDLLWLDSHPDIRADELRAFWPACTDRTIVAVHDTGPQHVVRPTVEQLAEQRLISDPLWLPTPRGMALARVCGTGR